MRPLQSLVVYCHLYNILYNSSQTLKLSLSNQHILEMDTTTQKLMSLLEDLDDDLDDLEESLAPLLKPALVETASKYPVLDRAKLYVLVTYAIESMLFCMPHIPWKYGNHNI